MTTSDLLVLLAGIMAIVWVNWYFLVAGRRVAGRGAALATVGTGGVQEVPIRVLGGYDPATVHVRAGSPVRLLLDRQETSGCSEEFVIPDFGIRRFLPPHQETVIEIKPEQPGSHEFTCGMGMLRGRLVVEE